MKVLSKLLGGTMVSLLLATSGYSADPTTDITWIGGSGNNMSVAGNWSPATALAAGDSYIWVFQGSASTRPILNAAYGVTTMIFSNNIIASWQGNGNNQNLQLGSYVIRQLGAGTIFFGSPAAGFVDLADAASGSTTTFTIDSRLDFGCTFQDGFGTSSTLVKEGTATFNLLNVGGANTYSGGTIVNAGDLRYTKGNGTTAIPGNVTLNNAGTMSCNIVGGNAVDDNAIVTINGTGRWNMIGQPEAVQTVESTSANATMLIGHNATPGVGLLTIAPTSSGSYNSGTGVSTFAGIIAGDDLQKNGDGTFEMLGVNTVTNIYVNNGTLKLNGNNGTGTIFLYGGTLLATGNVDGNVIGYAGTSLGAGLSAGLLTLGTGLDLSAGGTLVWELAANSESNPGTDFDQIVVTSGAVDVSSATLDLQFIGSATTPNNSVPFWQFPRSWTIISASSPPTGPFGTILNGTYPAGNFGTAISGNDVVLTFTPSGPPPFVPPVPKITSVVPNTPNPTSVTINYTNTLNGTNYVVQYRTNLNTTNWTSLGAVTAGGTTSSTVDPGTAGSAHRYYRVYGQF